MTLCDVTPGSAFTVRTVRTGGEIGKRLADMGFTEGVQGMVIRGALLRGPVQVRIRGYDLLIRRSEAAVIDVAEPSGVWLSARSPRCCESDSSSSRSFSSGNDWGHGWDTFSTRLAEFLGIHRHHGSAAGARGQGGPAGPGHGHSPDRHERNHGERGQRKSRS